MKKLLIISFFFMCFSILNAQNIKQKRVYQFNRFIAVDIEETYQCSGLIVFSEAGNHKFITVKLGPDVIYNGEIKYKKPAERDGNELVYVYLFTTKFQGIEVPVQLFEIYDIRKSTAIPTNFVISVHNVTDGTCVQTQKYEGISLIKQINPSNTENNRFEQKNSYSSSLQNSYKDITINGVSFKMIYVEGGTFMMGATKEQLDDAYDNEKPDHQVTLSSFYMGQTEVTQELWKAVMGDNPSIFTGRNGYDENILRPIENRTWEDCQMFINRLNALTCMNFRLPTEAEWEYAARGGNKSNGYKYSGSNNLDEVAWYVRNSGDHYLNGNNIGIGAIEIIKNNCYTHTVATKRPNELGLYDMSGNVLEWCEDWYVDGFHGMNYYYYSEKFNPKGPTFEVMPDYYVGHVHRGGSFKKMERGCRVSNRCGELVDEEEFGFRLVLEPEKKSNSKANTQKQKDKRTNK